LISFNKEQESEEEGSIVKFIDFFDFFD